MFRVTECEHRRIGKIITEKKPSGEIKTYCRGWLDPTTKDAVKECKQCKYYNSERFKKCL